ncbi:MAG: PQQ-like beta-propeller repeat protein, partial [candidate division KSB1 bacterium]|nr:PQQ-like beta-propeller repeat protein [candidate division KSB1 bacterium]
IAGVSEALRMRSQQNRAIEQGIKFFVIFNGGLLIFFGAQNLKLPLWTQSESAFRLQPAAKATAIASVPMIDRSGVWVGWQSPSHLGLVDHEGKDPIAIEAAALKYAVNSDGSALAVLEKSAKGGEENEATTLLLRCFDRDGQELGRYQFLQHDDDPLPHLQFNADRSHLALAQPALARLIFLQRDGQVLREKALFENAAQSLERPLFLAGHGEGFVVLSQPIPSTSSEAVAPVLIRFSAAGEEFWRRELPAGTPGGLAASEDGRWIVVSRYAVITANHAAEKGGPPVESTISIYDRNGELHATLEGLFRQAIFSRDGASLLLMDRRQLRRIDLPNGELQWQFNLSQRTEMFASVAANATLERAVALVGTSVFKINRFVFDDARLVGFDHHGQAQFETAIEKALVSPALAFSQDGQQLMLAAEGLLQRFTIVNVIK